MVLILQRDGADRATFPLHGRILESAHSSSILHLQPSCASTHTQHDTQPHTTTLHCPPPTILHCPFPLHVTPQRGTQDGKRGKGECKSAGYWYWYWGAGYGKWGGQAHQGTLGPYGGSCNINIRLACGDQNPLRSWGVISSTSHTCKGEHQNARAQFKNQYQYQVPVPVYTRVTVSSLCGCGCACASAS